MRDATDTQTPGSFAARRTPATAASIAQALLGIVLGVLILNACSSAPKTAQSPESSDSTRQTIASSPAQRSVPPFAPSLPETAASQPSWLPPPAPGPEPPAPPPDSEPPEADMPARAVGELITVNSQWHAPAFLKEGESDTIALSIGDVQRLQDRINATVPTVDPRAPLPVTVTAGTIVSAKLTVISSDAEVEPIDTIDKSIGDDVSILFSWAVKPKISGQLELLAFIDCPLGDGRAVTETVPFRISVRPVAPPSPSIGDRTRGLLDLLKDYWIQLTAIAGGLAAAARYGWRWWSRRDHRSTVQVEAPASGDDVDADIHGEPSVRSP